MPPIKDNNVVTITAKIGPGLQATALVHDWVSNLNFDFDQRTVTVHHGHDDGSENPVNTIYDWDSIVTLTWSISGRVSTVVISE